MDIATNVTIAPWDATATYRLAPTSGNLIRHDFSDVKHERQQLIGADQEVRSQSTSSVSGMDTKDTAEESFAYSYSYTYNHV